MQAVTGVAPGRVNLIGEHLDYNGGRCLPIAIQRRTRAEVDRIPGPAHVMVSPGAPPGWSSYPVAMLRALEVTTPLSISISSDVPIGAGLSSSAALLCSVGVAVNELLGLGLSTMQLQAAAIRAESVHVGAPTGGLDQTVCMHARAGHALLIDFKTAVTSQHSFDLDALDLAVLVINTGVTHEHLTGGYRERRIECAEAGRILGVEFLVDATPDHSGLTETQVRRVRHVVTENQRVLDFVEALDDPLTMGRLMLASHESLRDDFEVSCQELDLAVESAMRAGALGARMTGGGFGGSAIALVQSRFADAVSDAVRNDFARAGWAEPEIFPVTASAGAHLDSG